MYRAGQAGIEAVDGPQDLQWLLWIMQLIVILQRGLVRPRLILRVARTCIPRGGHYRLVVADLAIIDDDEMRQPAAGRFHEAYTLGMRRPGRENRGLSPIVPWFGVLGLFIGSSVGSVLGGIFDPSLNGTGLPELLPVGWDAQMSIIFATGLAAALYGLFHLPALPAASVAAYRTAVAEHGSHPSFGDDIFEQMRTSPVYSHLPHNIWNDDPRSSD